VTAYYTLIKPPLFPKCYIDENPLGYLIRLTEINKYSSYRWLIESANRIAFFPSHRRLTEILKKSKWTGYAANENIVQELINLKLAYFERKTLRFCPSCLNENSYYRIQWQLRVDITCSVHGVWLEDECYSCGKPIGIGLSKIKECQCGADLGSIIASPASPDILNMQKFLWGIEYDDDSIIPKDNDLSFSEKINLIIFLSRWLVKRKSTDSLINLDVSRESLNDVAEVLFGGEPGFFNYINRLQIRGNDTKYKNIFERFNRLLYRDFNQPCFDKFKNLLEEYINKNIYKPLTKRNKNYKSETILKHPWIPFQVACREFDIHKSILRRVIRESLIRSKKEIKNGRTYINIYRPDLEARIGRINDTVTAKEAAAILGLTKSQFSTLREQNIFKLKNPPSIDTGCNWQFSRNEISLYRDSFTFEIKEADGDLWSFSQILQYFGGQIENPLITLLRAISEKKLLVSILDCNKSGLASMMFSKNNFVLWFEKYKSKSTVFKVPVVAKIMALNQEFTYQLVNEGILKSNVVGESNVTEITEEQISDFHNEYVLLSKLAKKIFLSSRTLIKYLASKEIYPVDYYAEKKLRQKVYKMNDLVDVKIFNGFL
jgi:hypothetical protein